MTPLCSHTLQTRIRLKALAVLGAAVLFTTCVGAQTGSTAQSPSSSSALTANNSGANAVPSVKPATTNYPKVKLTTSQGDIVMELYPDKAPKTVANFLQYVKEKHYDGTIFHRVINDFMIQGGGYDAKFIERATHAPIMHEGREALSKGLKNVTGTVAMARTGDPNSASAQFFINVRDNTNLDPVIIPPGDPVPAIEFQGHVYTNISRAQLEHSSQLYGYTVFGKVISGMETVDKIKALPTGASGPFPSDVPRSTVLIQTATLLP